MLDDSALLRRFAATRAEDDFAEIVQRHLNLVYSAALRQVGGDHQFAEEVAQSVFTDLARKAGSVGNHVSLAGWLYTSAHYAAAKMVRSEQRRRLREQEASQMQQTHTEPSPEPDWEQLQPVIDEAMHALPEADREVILQRYFQRMPFLQIGARHGLTENAARMRAERALDKLRGILATRGVSATTVALATGLTAQAVLVAPATLAATVVSTSLAAGVAVASGGLIALAKLKVLIPSVCAVALLVGVISQQLALNRLREENAALRRYQAVADATVAEAKPVEAMEAEQREKLELLRLRGAVGRLRRELVEQQALAANVAATNGASVATQQKTEPQVNIRARFFTGTDEALEFIKDDATAIVAASEIRNLLTHLRESGNAELLAEQSVTTLSGRQAQVQSLEVRTNLSTGAVTESGYVVDVLPSVREDRNTVALTLVVSEYKDKPVITEGVQPLPIFTVRPMTANAVVWDGQTVVMATRSNGKKVVAIVTPTLINPAGNRVHPDAEL